MLIKRLHNENARKACQQPMDINVIRRSMPKIGDRVRLRPVTLSCINYTFHDRLWGRVVYVNWQHLYYTVEFDGSGLRESFKPIGEEDIQE